MDVLRKHGPERLKETLTCAIESLYKDRIRPLVTYVKGRLKERGEADAIVKTCVELCSKCRRPSRLSASVLAFSRRLL